MITLAPVTSRAQVSTPTPSVTETASEPTEIVKSSTVVACRDAFARVPILEGLVASERAAKEIETAKATRLALLNIDLEKNFADFRLESRNESKELRAEILELTRIARKRTKICFIC